MLTIVLGLALALPVNKEPAQYMFQITIYQGNPDLVDDKSKLTVIARPLIVTRDNQDAVMSVSQQLPITSDIKQEVGKKIITVSDVQTGIILKLLPKAQKDGSVFIKGSASLSEAVSNSSILVKTLTFHELLQLGVTRNVNFYNPESFVTQTIGADGVKSVKKIYTGREIWMEIKVVEAKEMPAGLTPLIPVPVAVKP